MKGLMWKPGVRLVWKARSGNTCLPALFLTVLSSQLHGLEVCKLKFADSSVNTSSVDIWHWAALTEESESKNTLNLSDFYGAFGAEQEVSWSIEGFRNLSRKACVYLAPAKVKQTATLGKRGESYEYQSRKKVASWSGWYLGWPNISFIFLALQWQYSIKQWQNLLFLLIFSLQLYTLYKYTTVSTFMFWSHFLLSYPLTPASLPLQSPYPVPLFYLLAFTLWLTGFNHGLSHEHECKNLFTGVWVTQQWLH